MSAKKASEHRPGRLRLHGPDAFQRLQARQRLLRPRVSPGARRRSAAGRPRGPRRSPSKWGYESIETDWRKLVERKDIDAIDICTPNNTHAEIAIAAAEAGKMILCEKPLSMNLVEGQKMVDAVEKAGVPNTVWYNYRRVPAVTLAKQLIDAGRLGKIFHYRANFLQDWTISADLPQGGTGLWRLDVAAAGSGVTGDLLAHCIDTALWLNGSIDSVSRHDRDVRQGAEAQPDRQGRAGGHRRRLRVPLPVRQRLARPLRVDPLRPRPQGALHLRGQRREGLAQVGPATTCTGSSTSTTATTSIVRGWRSIHVTDGDHPYMKNWWVPGLQIGYEHTFVHQVADFLDEPGQGPADGPDLPRRPGDAGRLRRRARLGRAQQVGVGRAGLDRHLDPQTPILERNDPCKTGMNLLLWTTHVTEQHDAILDQIKELGFDAVEVPIFDTADLAPFERLGKRIKSLGLGATAVTVMGAETNPISPDPKIRDAAVAHLDRVMECGQAFGCEILCGPIHSAIGVFSGEGPTEDEFKYGVETLQRAAEKAQARGIKIAVEYLNRFEIYFLTTAAQTARFVRAVDHPYCKMMYDSFHAHIEEKDQAQAIASCAAETIHVHVSENDRGIPGTGQVHWDGFFQRARSRAGTTAI